MSFDRHDIGDDDDDALYDDLEMSSSNQQMPSPLDFTAPMTACSLDPSSTAPVPHNSATKTPPPPKHSLTAHVETLTATVQQLSTENETLKRNMGILFRTARAEIQRKDDQIQRLQAALDAK
jgi:hypothetical protein